MGSWHGVISEWFYTPLSHRPSPSQNSTTFCGERYTIFFTESSRQNRIINFCLFSIVQRLMVLVGNLTLIKKFSLLRRNKVWGSWVDYMPRFWVIWSLAKKGSVWRLPHKKWSVLSHFVSWYSVEHFCEEIKFKARMLIICPVLG